MQARPDSHTENNQTVKTSPGNSLFDRIGWHGLFLVVWRSTPVPLRLVALPYGILVYRKLLAACSDSNSLYTLHVQQYEASLLFRLLRPRYRRVDDTLRALDPNGGRGNSA